MPLPLAVTVGTVAAQWPIAGIHGTALMVTPSTGAPFPSTAVSCNATSPRSIGLGDVRALTCTLPDSDTTLTTGAPLNVPGADEPPPLLHAAQNTARKVLVRITLTPTSLAPSQPGVKLAPMSLRATPSPGSVLVTACALGTSTSNVVPSPALLWMRTLPPCASMICFTM